MDKIDWKGKRVLLTGGTGFIGSHLTKRLLDNGADVALFVLDEEHPIPNGVTVFRGNIQDAPDIERAIGRFLPEYIFHLAAQPLVDTALRNIYDTLDTNIRGSINLLGACVPYKDKIKGIVWTSTDKVYGETKNVEGSKESDPLDGYDHPYNASKVCGDIMAHMFAQVFGLRIIIVRSGNVYGPGDTNWDRLIPGMFKAIYTGQTPKLRSDGSLRRDYIYIDDIVDAQILSAEAISSPEIVGGVPVNFGSIDSWSVKEVLHMILESVQRIDLTEQTIIENTAQHELKDQHLNWTRAKRWGWSPKVDMKTGLKLSSGWYWKYFEDKNVSL